MCDIILAMFNEFRISVRTLVEFLLRSGDIDNKGMGSSEEAMLAGSRMHRKLQKEAGDVYQAEVPLSIVWEMRENTGDGSLYFPLNSALSGNSEKAVPEEEALPEEQKQTGGGSSGQQDHRAAGALPSYSVIVEGRADGIYYNEDGDWDSGAENVGENTSQDCGLWMIDEIKTTYRRLNTIIAPDPVHLAQAKCYAYMYGVLNGLTRVGVRMTYCNLITEKIRYFYEENTIEELTSWFDDLMSQYKKWADFEYEWGHLRTDSIRALPFPFDYREGQKDLAAAVYRTIIHGRKLFMEAPTGTGKTITTLFPAIKSMGEGKSERIFYLTAKTIARTAAQDAVSLMRDRGLRVKSVTLTSKEKACIFARDAGKGQSQRCDPAHCPRAKGHFDRINDCLYHLLNEQDIFERPVLERYAEEYSVCPFELGLDVSLFSDVVIGDYNYLFDPHAHLRRFFGEMQGKHDYLFLIDEAHNLIERGREMYSAAIVKEDVLAIKLRLKGIYPALVKKLNKCNKALLEIKNSGKTAPGESGGQNFRESATVLEEIDSFGESVRQVHMEIGSILQENRVKEQSGQAKRDPLWDEKKEVQEELLQFYFELQHFVDVLDNLDEHYTVFAREGREGFSVRLYCMDPSVNLQRCLDKGKAAVLFSATFLPIQYYKSLLGGREEDYEVYAHSVFDSRRRGLYVVSDVTSRYTRRSDEEFRRIAQCIHSITKERHGNYIVFFPSYEFMRQVVEQLSEFRMEDTLILRQQSSMREEEREAFLAQFAEVSDERTLIGLCVLGGIFSEGIDLKNDSLIGVIIVGTGVPQVCTERELIKQYYDQNGQFGYDYAYRFPGMNKVLQAAGRVIRTEEDTGIVVLLDERFLTPAYRRLFPREWENVEVTDSRDIGRRVERFWDEWL